MAFIDAVIDVCHWMALAARVAVEIWCWATDRNAPPSPPSPQPPRVRCSTRPVSHPLPLPTRPPRRDHRAPQADFMRRLNEHRIAAKAMRDSESHVLDEH